MKTTSDQVVDILVTAGVGITYGVPGDAIDLILSSIQHRDDIEFILTRHEEAAGFMASAQAKLNGSLGVLMACQGPGTAHLLNAMYDAKMDKVPMLVLTGQVDSHMIGTNTVQEINQLSLFEDVALFNREARSAENLVDILQLAIQTAISKRCVAHISIPTDLLRQPAAPRMPSTGAFTMPYHMVPCSSALKAAANLLNQHDCITILYGGGCRGAEKTLLNVAQRLKAPMVHTVRSKDIIDNNHPHYVGGIGFKGSKNGCHYVAHCDALLVVGCSFAWRDFYPKKAPIIQIDVDPQRIGTRCNVSVGLLGQAKPTLDALGDLLTQKKSNKFLHSAQKAHHKAIAALDKKASLKKGQPITSPLVTSVVSDALTHDAILTVDAGTVSVWANNWLRLNGKQRLIGSTELGTMGFGMPAALGCQLAEPEKLVVALCGDGGFQMTMADFSTAVKYQLPINVIVYNSFSYHFIELEQMKEGIAPAYTKLSNPDYAALAKAFGGEGFKVTQVDVLEEAILQAFSSSKPCIVDVSIDPDELISPTKLSADMLWSFAKGMLRMKWSKLGSD